MSETSEGGNHDCLFPSVQICERVWQVGAKKTKEAAARRWRKRNAPHVDPSVCLPLPSARVSILTTTFKHVLFAPCQNGRSSGAEKGGVQFQWEGM